jgi:hypothetical protein
MRIGWLPSPKQNLEKVVLAIFPNFAQYDNLISQNFQKGYESRKLCYL